jgi:hypothetical protein
MFMSRDIFTSEWHVVDLQFKFKIVFLSSYMDVYISDEREPKELRRKS